MPDEPAHVTGGLVAELSHRMQRELRAEDACSNLALEGLTLELLAEICRLRSHRPARPEPPWLATAREYLRDRPAAEFSLAQLAAAVGAHPVQLAQAFRKFYGCTAGEYVRRLRVARARELVTGTSRPLAEIALECGFCDQSHLTRSFKRLTGVTPSRVRDATRATRTDQSAAT